MATLRHIRKQVLGLTQAEMAAIAGVSQGQVSKWETGVLSPSLPEMERIRAHAMERGIDWDDRWFFEVAA